MSLFSSVPRVLDVDGSVRRQGAFLRESGAIVLGLESWGARLRYICRRSVRGSFERWLGDNGASQLTFYGSGDFHHLTFSLLKFHCEPLSVVVFDQHPDWDVTSPFPCCGTWVNEALALPWIERVVVIGAGSEDLGGAQLWRGNRGALASGKLEIYPATLESSLWPGLTHRMACGERRGGRMRWRTVKEHGMSDIVEDVVRRLPTKRVYVSVDKDCLRAEDALSNWDAGELTLGQVCAGIKLLRQRCEVVGADVTGEWSLSRINNPIVSLLSRSDHPDQMPPTAEQLQVNERTNIALWRAFGG